MASPGPTGTAYSPHPDPYTDQVACAACTHDHAAHDPIAARFCAATTAGGLDRGCACPAGSLSVVLSGPESPSTGS